MFFPFSIHTKMKSVFLEYHLLILVKTFKILAEAFGVIHELLTELNIKYEAVLPIKWKAHFKIAGKGRTQEKKLTQAYVFNTYNLVCSEDEADSFCIGMYYLDLNNAFDWSE